MSRAAWLRIAAGIVLIPGVSLLSAECGGNDVLDPFAASTDGSFDEAASNEGGDAGLDVGLGDSGMDAKSRFGDAESGAPEAGDAAEAGNAAEAGDASPIAPLLRTAKSFALLASNTITNVDTPAALTAIFGDVGIAPGMALVALPPAQVTGTIHLGDSVAMQAEADRLLAYNDLAARPCSHNLTSMDLGGQTLAPGVYCFDSSAGATHSNGTLTLDGQGDMNAVWIFQIASTLTVGPNTSVILKNSGNGCNVYWQVGSSATINTGAQIVGNILTKASSTLLTGAKVVPGRVLAEVAVTLGSNSVSNAGCQ